MVVVAVAAATEVVFISISIIVKLVQFKSLQDFVYKKIALYIRRVFLQVNIIKEEKLNAICKKQVQPNKSPALTALRIPNP